MIRQIQLIELQAEKAERYLRFYQLRDTHSWWSRDTAAEHRDLLATIKRDQKGSRDSVAAIARHLARTALWVIAEAEPERDPLSIRLALQMALSTATSDPQTGHAPRQAGAEFRSMGGADQVAPRRVSSPSARLGPRSCRLRCDGERWRLARAGRPRPPLAAGLVESLTSTAPCSRGWQCGPQDCLVLLVERAGVERARGPRTSHLM